ncbi:NIPSNAP family protein [Eoetvoesiella caeni]
MFIEHRTYAIQPGKLQEYLNVYGEFGWEAHSNHTPCKGHYYTEAGAMNRVISLWQYDSLADRAERGKQLRADPRWQDAFAKIAPLVMDIQSNLLLPSPFWSPASSSDK